MCDCQWQTGLEKQRKQLTLNTEVSMTKHCGGKKSQRFNDIIERFYKGDDP